MTGHAYQTPGTRGPRGFTLLEIMITTLLSVVLLLTLWAIFGMYVRLFDSGEERAGHSQLVRGLTQQIVDDLHGAIQDTAEAPPGGLGAARRFGLFGSSHTLQVDVLQAGIGRPASDVSAAPADLLDPSPGSQAYELRTVRYTFFESREADDGSGTRSGGLLRQEFDFSTPADASSGAAPDGSGPNGPAPSGPTSDGSNPDDSAPDDSAAGPQPPAAGADAPPDELSALNPSASKVDDPSVTWVPEVADLEFRYFDGVTWNSTWNSLQRKSLPVAVEVVIQLVPTEDAQRKASAAATQDAATSSAAQPTNSDEDADVLAYFADDTQTPSGPTCRTLVELPTAALRRDQSDAAARQPSDDTLAAVPDQPPDQPAPADNPIDQMLGNPPDQGQDPSIAPDLTMPGDDPSMSPGDPRSPAPDDQPNFAPRDRRRSRRPPWSTHRDTVIEQIAPDQWMRGGGR